MGQKNLRVSHTCYRSGVWSPRRTNELAHDPIHTLRLDRDPLTGAARGSQPTLSRFETGRRRAASPEWHSMAALMNNPG
jgi:hypothetical protein